MKKTLIKTMLYICLLFTSLFTYANSVDTTYREDIVGTWKADSQYDLGNGVLMDATLTFNQNGTFKNKGLVGSTLVFSVEGTWKIENGVLSTDEDEYSVFVNWGYLSWDDIMSSDDSDQDDSNDKIILLTKTKLVLQDTFDDEIESFTRVN